MGPIVKLLQGNYGSDGTLKTSSAGDPVWAPDPGTNYLVMAQSTVATSGTHAHTVGVQFTLAAVADPSNPLYVVDSTTKVASGGPSAAPMCYLAWYCPLDWSGGDVVISAAAVGNDPHLSSSCWFSIVVVEIEQPGPEA